jgi:hypothetical protein
MKRTALILLCILKTVSVFAQKDYSRWSVEVLAGPSFSTFYASDAPVKLFEEMVANPAWARPAGYKVEEDMAYYPYTGKALVRIRTDVTFRVLAVRSLTGPYALVSGLAYEQKGVDHSESYTLRQGVADTVCYRHGELRSRIKNKYLTVPLLVRRTYASGITLDGGAYISCLVSSLLDQQINKEGYDQRGQLINRWGSMIHFRQRPNTARVDAGVMLAAGYRRPIGERMALLARVGGSVGLLKLDREYDNDFSLKPFFNGYLLANGNYHGYSSHARNVQLQAMVGLSRTL